jgi:hypothetical protein
LHVAAVATPLFPNPCPCPSQNLLPTPLHLQVQLFLRFIDRMEGHFKWRWGDAPVQTLAMQLFLEKEQLLEFTFPYVHLNTYSANERTSGYRHFPHTAAP